MTASLTERMRAANVQVSRQLKRIRDELAVNAAAAADARNALPRSRPIETEYHVKEAGRNGLVRIEGRRIIRTFKRTFGRDDVQVIPVSSVSHVHIDRRTLGSDVLTVHVGVRTYEWKTPRAEELAYRILDLRENPKYAISS